MGLPVEINPLLISSSGYVVGRSLRFRSSASAYLNRTFGTPTNNLKWTWSSWVKRGALSSDGYLINAGAYALEDGLVITSNNNIAYYIQNGGSYYFLTSQVFRDPSAWYHVVFVYDSANATASNRMQLFINGVQVTAFSTANYPTQNYSSQINSAIATRIGIRGNNSASPFDGYLAEVNFIDGQALTPSSFGAYDTNGVWQPLKYGGTYGTNGFYLPFSDTTSTTTLCYDKSGNGNNWTPNNISLTAGTTYDSMIDSPTVSAISSNYCVFNPVSNLSASITDANLSAAISDNSGNMGQGTFGMSSGKWYWEATMSSTRFLGGIRNVNNAPVSTTSVDPHFAAGTGAYGFATGTDIGTNYDYYNASTPTRVATTMQATTGVVVQFAFDADNGKLWLGLNGTWQSSGSPSAGTGNLVSPPTGNTYVPMLGLGNSSLYGVYANFGQRPFSYTPPSGFKALNTYNLPAPSIANGAQYMAATTYTGTGATQNVSNAVNGVSFQPDFAWIKVRSTAAYHALVDSLRVGTGGLAILSSNATDAEWTSNLSNYVTGFNSNGIALGNQALTAFYVNRSGDTYVGWQWKAGGTGVTNTSGSITSTVSANTTAGFSVATFTTPGGSNPQTIGHGLGVAPSMIIMKSRNNVSGWTVYHSAIGNTGALNLSATTATSTSIDWWQNTSPTSSVWSIGANLNISGWTWVAYCFAAVRGYSAFGSYTGNGSTDGPFVYLGFRPRFVLIRRSNNTGYWLMKDSSRNGYNQTDPLLYANVSDAEYAAADAIDILSNGFKVRASNLETNGSGDTLIYAAFAENPFNYSRAR